MATSFLIVARQLLDHALAGRLPPLQEDQEIGHLLPVRLLVELPDDIGADLAGGGQDPKEIPTRLGPARQRGEPHPPKNTGRERISGLAAGRAAGAPAVPGLTPPLRPDEIERGIRERLDALGLLPAPSCSTS